MSIIAVFGCYERTLFGFEIVKKLSKEEQQKEAKSKAEQKKEEDSSSDSEEDKVEKKEEEQEEEDSDEVLQLKKVFSYAPHLGAIKATAASGRMLVSGGSDEKINVYDLKKLREVGQLHNHGGNITVIAFAGNGAGNAKNANASAGNASTGAGDEKLSHMISGSSDGMMCLWKCQDWSCISAIHVHTGNVVSLALHPSHRLALSVGDDNLLKIWNLLTSKLSSSLTLEHAPSQVLFNPSGTLFIIVFPTVKQIDVYNAGGTKLRTLEFPYRIATAVFLNDHTVAAAGEGEKSDPDKHDDKEYTTPIGVWDTEKGFSHAIQLNLETRVKVLVALPPLDHLLEKKTAEPYPYVLVGCSTGLVIVMSLSTGEILATTSTEARLTCASISTVAKDQPKNTSGKKDKKKKKNNTPQIKFEDEQEEHVKSNDKPKDNKQTKTRTPEKQVTKNKKSDKTESKNADKNNEKNNTDNTKNKNDSTKNKNKNKNDNKNTDKSNNTNNQTNTAQTKRKNPPNAQEKKSVKKQK